MAKRKKRKKKRKLFRLGLERETLYGIATVLFLVLAVFFTFAAFEGAGVTGRYTYDFLASLLGVGYFLLPVLSLLLAIAFFTARHQDIIGTAKALSSLLFLASGLGLIELLFDEAGGLIGGWIALPLVQLFDTFVSGVVLFALLIISLLIMFSLTTDHLRGLWESIRRGRESLHRKKSAQGDPSVYEMTAEEEKRLAAEEEAEADDESDMSDAQSEEDETDPSETPEKKKKKGLFGKKTDDEELAISPDLFATTPYNPPPTSLLEQTSGKAQAGDVKASANIIKRTLANFGIEVEIEEVTVGPSITRYAMKPAEGVRLSRILSLQNNLELALAAHPVRIEAPIPGKSLVGIEVPNTAKSTVGIASLLKSKEFTENKKPLSIPLGRAVSGKVHTASINAMPHLLIAGATGAGKSVTIHTLITSLLYRNGPSMLKYILIDPKRVELTLYNDIPHLLTPVITDAKQAVLALKWLTNEMERRYDVLEEKRVRDISSYHNTILKPALDKKVEPDSMPESLPYIVLVIDELADIMSTYPRELEASIVRIAQMSRAVGIHLVLSTQRPSVNVITGLIKANIPARIALQVASQVDSRTILDMAGAEKLLGAGDMLFVSGEMSKPVRLQSGYISEGDVKKVSAYLKKHHTADEDEIIFSDEGIESTLDGGTNLDDEEDELYEDARETVIAAGKASTSYLQRKLRVGYARAARLIDMLEERGVVGPADGSRPRDIIDSDMQQEDNG